MTVKILLISLLMKLGFVTTVQSHLSKEDVLLLNHEPNPKCFTRTEKDFTCFFETADNRTYDLLYTFQSEPTERCELSAQRTEEGTILHVCRFPDSDVQLYLELHLEVVERSTNSSLYIRRVSVEDHVLLAAPFNVSLHPMGAVGQMKVSWNITLDKYLIKKTVYRIRYYSRTLGEKIEKMRGHILAPLVPGEEVEVQLSAKSASGAGHWSSWSLPVKAAVPQSADDVSLSCCTSDLHHITCFWNGSRYGAGIYYKLFYRMSPSEAGSWSEWSECLFEANITDLCHFLGDKVRKVQGKLISTLGFINRLFYTKEFTLNHSIKTSAPAGLRGVIEKTQLCLEWEAPLPSLLPHLQYELDHRTTRGEGWRRITGPETEACVEVPAGSQYSVKVRAKPTGPSYSGHWSNWSHVLTGDSPTDVGMWLMLCIPVLMLMIASILFCLFSSHLRKIKQYFWPPVPNLDKVLQSFLTEISKQSWDPPITVKQCLEETTSSVVEVMTKDEGPVLGNPSVENAELLSEETFSSSKTDDCSLGVIVASDYVSLNKDGVSNSYIYEQVGERGDDLHCSEGSQCTGSCCPSTELLNQSYLPLAECVDTLTWKTNVEQSPGNVYTNVLHS